MVTFCDNLNFWVKLLKFLTESRTSPLLWLSSHPRCVAAWPQLQQIPPAPRPVADGSGPARRRLDWGGTRAVPPVATRPAGPLSRGAGLPSRRGLVVTGVAGGDGQSLPAQPL